MNFRIKCFWGFVFSNKTLLGRGGLVFANETECLTLIVRPKPAQCKHMKIGYFEVD